MVAGTLDGCRRPATGKVAPSAGRVALGARYVVPTHHKKEEPMLPIDPDKVCTIIVMARAFDAKTAVVEPDPGSNQAEDDMIEVIEDYPDDATQEELREFIQGLNEDEQVALVALAWIGRGSFSKEESDDAVREARHAHNDRTAEYLMGLPLLGDYLADGLAEFGHTCDE
jgi:hypothetical protein